MIVLQVELHTLELSPSLRSLSLIKMPRLKASCIINFLTREVNYEGVMVAREHLLEDLTLFDVDKKEMFLLYESTALTQRMKSRVRLFDLKIKIIIPGICRIQLPHDVWHVAIGHAKH